MLHVGIVVHSLNHNNIGRVYPFLRAFANSHDVQLRLIGWSDGGELFPLLRGLPWPIVTLPGSPTGTGAAHALVEALRGCDLIQCFKNGQHVFAVARAVEQLGLPLVLDLDDWELGLYLEGVVRWPWWRRALSGIAITRRIAVGLEAERLARTLPVALTVNSRALQGYFGGQIVYTAADAQAFDPSGADGMAFRLAHGLTAESLVIGFLGTPHPHKGIDDLLDAFALLRSQFPAARLLFVGVPAHNAYANRLHATPGVIVTGYVGAEVYPLAYAACDVVAIPQRAVTEGIVQTPAKLILALAAGRAIVATTVGDVPNILGEAGILVPPQDPTALANALGNLLADHKQRTIFGGAARARFLEAFTLELLRDTMLVVYRQS